jgi:hypothetical protein
VGLDLFPQVGSPLAGGIRYRHRLSADVFDAFSQFANLLFGQRPP